LHLVAVAAAILVLFSKVTFAAWTMGAPAPAMVDAFGNPLCIVDSSDNGDPAGHHALADCCILGCSQAAAWLPSDELGGVTWRLAFPVDAPGRPLVASHGRSKGHQPGNPRAPPAAA